MMSKKQGRQYAPLSVVEPPSILSNWAQATINLQTLYMVLQETIAKRKQDALKHLNTCPVSQCSLSTLEEVRLGVLQELDALLNQMDEPSTDNQEENKRLYAHTIRFQKQTNRIQSVLWLDELIAC